MRQWNKAALFLGLAIVLAGCSHFRPASSREYVYVAVKQMYLRDRVAVVANRVAEVTNGERLLVIQHIPRFLQVKTPQGEVGWIEDHAVIDQSEFDDFQNLAKQHSAQTPIATAILYNELYMHLTPGRSTQHFYLVPINAKVSLLERASVPRYPDRGVLGLPSSSPKPGTAVRTGKSHKEGFESKFLPSVPMEDWWLVRDGNGHTGWMLSRDLDVNVPDAVAQYAENERMIGAWVLRTVQDQNSGTSSDQVPEYLTVLTPYKEGLPYDFDQVRVFTWDVQRHRYGTSFRLRDVAGFFPVQVMPGDIHNANGPVPRFTFQVADGDSIRLDPKTGMPSAAQLKTLTYEMEGNLVRQVLPAGAKPLPAATTRTAPSRIRHIGKRHKHFGH